MKNEKIILLVLAGSLFTHIMDFMIIMPMGPLLMRTFEIDSREFSLIVSSYSFSAFISGIFASLFIDRFDRKNTFLISYAGFTIGTFMCGIAPGFLTMLIARSITGLFGGVVGALVLSIVSDLIPLERRARGIGFVMASFSVASVFGVPFGLFLSTSYGWHFPFLFLGFLGIGVILLSWIILPKMTNHLEEALKSRPLENIKRIIARKNPQQGLLFTALLMLGHFSVIPFIAAYMVGNVGFSESDLTYIYLIGGGLTIFSSPMIGRLADRKGHLKIFILFGILVFIPVIWITHMPPSPLWLALIATGLFFILANGRMVPSTTMVTSIIKPENRGAFMSLRSSIQQLFSGIAALIAGLIVSEVPSTVSPGAQAIVNYNYVGYFAVFFSILALLSARKLTVEAGS